MIRNYVFFLALFVTGQLYGQSDEKSSFTLEEAIQYALQNGVRSKNAVLDQRIANAKVKETVGIGLPQVSADAGITNNTELPRFFSAYNPNSSFFANQPPPPGVNTGDVIALNNFFQLPRSANASVTLNQLIFNGSYIVGLKAANTFKELSVKTTERTQEDIIQQVAKAYYGVLINRERTTLFESNIARVDSLLRNTKAMNENGFAESIDVDRVRVTLNNLRTEREKFLNLNELALQLLKFQMNYPSDKPISIVGDIAEIHVDTTMSQYTRDGWDYNQRPDYKVLQVNQRLQELNLKNQYATALPVISAFGNLGWNTQSPNISGLFATNTNIKDENGLGPDKWYRFSSIGISMHIPLFTGLSRTSRIQQEKLKLLQIDNEFVNMRNAIDLEIKQSSLVFENALNTLAAQRENQELASNVARVTKIKYQEGVGSSLEVTDAENSLITAQTNFYSALFDAMVAKVDLDKAFGRLLPSTYQNNALIKSGK